MKSKLILLIIFIFSIYGLSAQSKKETEDWITTKFQYYRFVDGTRLLKNIQFLEVQDGYLIIFEKLNNGSILYNKILLNKIFSYNLSKASERFGGGYGLDLTCENRNYCIEQGVYNQERNEFIRNTNIKNYFIMLRLNSEFEEDDIPNRMIKAIKHLVKLYGGKEIQEEKEAF